MRGAPNHPATRISSCVIIIGIALGAGFAGAARAAASETKVVFLPPPELPASFVDELRGALESVAPVPPAEAVRVTLDTAKLLGLACDTTKPECLVRLGGLAGGDLVVGGSFDASASKLSLRSFDVVRGKQLAAAERDLSADAALDPGVRTRTYRQLAVRLITPERERGTIAVSVKQTGAAIFVDNVARGVSPMSAPIEVVPGRHEVYVARAGFESETHSVEVMFESTTKIDIDLKASTSIAPSTSGSMVNEAAPQYPQAPFVERDDADSKIVRVAVYDVDASGLEPRQVRVITDALLLELRKLERISVIGLDEVRALIDLEGNRQLMGCDDDASCVAEIADALSADVVLTGTAAIVGDGSVFALKRLDARTARTGQVTKHLERAHGEELLAAIGPSIEELFAEFPLRKGAVRGAPPELALRLNPPPLPTWAFWTTATSASLLALATTGAGVLNLASRESYGALRETPNDASAYATTEQTVKTSALLFWIGVGATTAVAAAAGVEALFTDWNGYGAGAPNPDQTHSKVPDEQAAE